MIRNSSNRNGDALANDGYGRAMVALKYVAGISMVALWFSYLRPDLWYAKWAFLISNISWAFVMAVILNRRNLDGMLEDVLMIYSLRIQQYSYAFWPFSTSLDSMLLKMNVGIVEVILISIFLFRYTHKWLSQLFD